MRRRLTIGGIVILGLGIIVGMLSGLFPGFGSAGSRGEGDAFVSLDSNAQAVSDAPPERPQEPQPESETDDHRDAQPPNVIDVLVEDRSYALRTVLDGKEEYRPIELADLIKLARKTRGNDEGIRVRIVCRKSARVTAENLLKEKLYKAGLNKQSIYWQEKLLP